MTENSEKRMSETAAVEEVIRSILSDSARLKSRDEEETQFFLRNAAEALGYSEPFSAEQSAMNTILVNLRAGNACCEQAWNLYQKLMSAS